MLIISFFLVFFLFFFGRVYAPTKVGSRAASIPSQMSLLLPMVCFVFIGAGGRGKGRGRGTDTLMRNLSVNLKASVCREALYGSHGFYPALDPICMLPLSKYLA